MSTQTVQTVPASDIRPGDRVDTAGAISASTPEWRVRVREVATVGGFTYVMSRQSGDLVPSAFVFRADQAVRAWTA